MLLTIIAALLQHGPQSVTTILPGASERFTIDGFEGFCLGLRPWEPRADASCTINFSSVNVTFTERDIIVGYHGRCPTEEKPLILAQIPVPHRGDRETSNAIRQGLADSRSVCIRQTEITQAEYNKVDKIASIMIAAVKS